MSDIEYIGPVLQRWETTDGSLPLRRGDPVIVRMASNGLYAGRIVSRRPDASSMVHIDIGGITRPYPRAAVARIISTRLEVRFIGRLRR